MVKSIKARFFAGLKLFFFGFGVPVLLKNFFKRLLVLEAKSTVSFVLFAFFFYSLFYQLYQIDVYFVRLTQLVKRFTLSLLREIKWEVWRRCGFINV